VLLALQKGLQEGNRKEDKHQAAAQMFHTDVTAVHQYAVSATLAANSTAP
jgi:hypothetical protein